jgi:hypothetical protein
LCIEEVKYLSHKVYNIISVPDFYIIYCEQKIYPSLKRADRENGGSKRGLAFIFIYLQPPVGMGLCLPTGL